MEIENITNKNWLKTFYYFFPPYKLFKKTKIKPKL